MALKRNIGTSVKILQELVKLREQLKKQPGTKVAVTDFAKNLISKGIVSAETTNQKIILRDRIRRLVGQVDGLYIYRYPYEKLSYITTTPPVSSEILPTENTESEVLNIEDITTSK